MTTPDEELRDAIARADRGMERTDNKGILLATMTTIAVAAAAALLAFPPPVAALVTGWTTVACLLATIALLAAAARPSLPNDTGDFGVMLWATSSPEQLTDHYHQVAADPIAYRSRELSGLGRMLRNKYRLQRAAFTVFITGLALGSLTMAIIAISNRQP